MGKTVLLFRSFFLVLIALVLHACGAGGGAMPQTSIPLPSNDVGGLQISNQMSLVSAKGGAVGSISELPQNSVKFAVPTSGEYVEDHVDVYVFDQAMEPIERINQIVCEINQTGYSSLVNEGDYIALVDRELCNRDQSSETNNQSSSQEQDFVQWYANVFRQDDNSVQQVNLWIPQFQSGDPNFGGQTMSLSGQLNVTEAVSDANPFGIFELQAGAYTTDGSLGLYAAIRASENTEGDIVLEMDNFDSVWGEQTQMYAVLDSGTDSGYGFTFKGITYFVDENGDPLSEPEQKGQTSRVAFDADYYLMNITENLYGSVNKNLCLERNNYRRNVWEYNLYDSNGSRVNLNSGFPIIYNDSVWGFADYYGIHFPPEEVSSVSGISVADDSGNNYTIFEGGGRLVKRTRNVLLLGDLIGDVFQWWDGYSGKQYEVVWDGMHFNTISEITYDENGQTIIPVSPTPIPLFPNQWFGLWKQGFGNLDIIIPDNGVVDNNLAVPYYTEEYQSPNDVATLGALYCYYDCPKGGVAKSDLDVSEPFYPNQDMDGSMPYEYTFDSSEYMLKYSGQNITVATGTEIDPSSFFSWGFRSGPLLTSPLTDPWLSWNQDVSYYWETGPAEFNKYRALIDANNLAVNFDLPVNCRYEDEDFGTFMLTYNGPGMLWGVPYDPVTDDDTGFEHWVARFDIPDGSALECGDEIYYSKGVIVEQYMNEVDLANCSHLSIPNDIPAPTVTFVDPGIGDPPTVTSQPRVVGGEVQE